MRRRYGNAASRMGARARAMYTSDVHELHRTPPRAWRGPRARGAPEGRPAHGRVRSMLSCTAQEEGHAMPDEISPQELKTRLDQKQPLVLLDVRDDWQTKLCRLQNASHIPLGEIGLRVDELDLTDETFVYCHHGVRSAAVADYHRQLGYAKAMNLAGGLDQWARTVDRSMRRY